VSWLPNLEQRYFMADSNSHAVQHRMKVSIAAHSQKCMLEWLKMSPSWFRLLKHCGLSTMPTSSPPSIMGMSRRKKSGLATCRAHRRM